MNDKAWWLLAQLSDGKEHPVRDLTALCDSDIGTLNALCHLWPNPVRALLQQHDNHWRLAHPLTVLPTDFGAGLLPGWVVRVVHECTSTNTVLMQEIKEGRDLSHAVLLANAQTQGRGRQGKTWLSFCGHSFTFSLRRRFQCPQAGLAALPLVVGMSVAETMQEFGVPLQVKWPNDLVIGAQKIGGILVESVAQGNHSVAVIGIGLNVYPAPHADPESAALAQWGNPAPRAWLASLLNRLDADLQRFDQEGFGAFQGAFAQVCRDIGRPVRLLQPGRQDIVGTMRGVDTDGALLLETAQGCQRFVGGHISLRPGAHAVVANPVIATVAPAAAFRQPESVAAQPNRVYLDSGNSQLKWVWAHDQHILGHGHAHYHSLEELAALFERFPGITRVIGCAVSGAAKTAVVESHIPLKVEWLHPQPHAAGIINHYRNPLQLGADRWFNALGARHFTQNACVVVSSGTAITIDALSGNNHFLGGSIMPGFNLMKEAMAHRTANLKQPIGRPYPFATSTSNALASGMTDAACGAVAAMWERLKKHENGKAVDILITGGGARKIAHHLPDTWHLDTELKIVDNLVIYGLMRWVESA